VSLLLNIPWKFVADGFDFINPLKGSVISLEFTNEGFEVSVQKNTEIRSTIPNFEGPMAVLSACAEGEEVLAVSGTAGKVMEVLSPGLDDSDQEDDVPDQSAEEPISVSPHFWALSVPSTSNIRIIEAQTHSEGSGLLKHNRYILDGRLPQKVFQISSYCLLKLLWRYAFISTVRCRITVPNWLSSMVIEPWSGEPSDHSAWR
jgi:hypothetical protein